VHHRADAVLAQYFEHHIAVADLTDDEGGIEHRLAKAPRQVIEHDHPFAPGAKLKHDVTTDIAGAAGHEDSGLIHAKCRYDSLGGVRASRR